MTVELTGTAQAAADKLNSNSQFIEGYIAGLIECCNGSDAKVLDIHAEVEE